MLKKGKPIGVDIFHRRLFLSSNLLLVDNKKIGQNYILQKRPNLFKVTAQFEAEGNSQNEIASDMDRSEVKL